MAIEIEPLTAASYKEHFRIFCEALEGTYNDATKTVVEKVQNSSKEQLKVTTAFE